MSEVLYLYCLARLGSLPPLPWQNPGLDGHIPLAVQGFRDLAAVFSPVPREDFCGPEAATHLKDLEWMGPRVLRHQEVVAAVMQHSPVLPVRFGTIFWSAARLEQVLRRHHDTIARFLTCVTGQAEWAVKGMLARAAAQKQVLARKRDREAGRLQNLAPGARYFQERRLQAESDQDLQHWLRDVGRELWSQLRLCAARGRERRLLSREATGSDRDMVLNWAFLVPDAAAADFQDRVQTANAHYGARGLELGCTGPWPPYSFTPALEPESQA